ncbi:lamin-B1-like isoform X16 [Sander lucioperca]|uniref:lamin-B1-like isoform X16 n=1 Tax=Sander lucioperca TaxID=283035 RepID=UPI00125D80DA|nr:lamin-B1-like isoform X16 [Sander lucioperca]
MTDTVQQNFRMLHQMAGLSLQSPPRTISVLAVLLLAHSCRGQSQLIGAPKPIVAAAGDDVILPCHLQPTEDVAAKTLEWTRPNLNPRFVFVWRAGQDLENVKNPSYKGRTLLFPDELKQGNMSLKLSKVKPSDAGRYKCYIPDMNIDSFIELVVGAVSLPFISLAGTDRDKGGVVLQCESKGWYPEPEVLWLDGEGNLLSAGPSETVRGPDDLYTVSSRVTVEKRPSNSFTCRVQQKNTNQTRETEIHVTDDFFEVQSSSSVPIITGLAVSLSVCIILFILLLLFSVWKWRQNKINMKISHGDETDKERNRTKDPSVTAEETKALTGEKVKKIKLEQQRREEAEREVQTLKEELETKKEEFESKLAEVQQQLKDEKQKHEDEQKALQKMKDDMQAKIKELEGKAGLSLYELKIFNKKTLEEEQQKREDAEKQVQILTQKLDEEEKQRSENEHLQKELEDKIKKFESKLAEVQQQLKDEKQKHEDAQQAHQKMKDDMQVKNKEFESKLAEVQQQLKDEKQKHEDAQQAHQKMKDDMQVKNKELEDKAGLSLEEQQKREEAEKPVQILTQKLDEKNNKSKEKVARSKSLRNWNIRSKSTREKEQQKKEEAEKEDLTQKLDDKNNEQVKDCESALSKSQDHTLTSPSFQDSATEHIIVDEVDLEGKYVRLSNKSNKDIPLGGWELHLHVDNRKPIKYQFVQTFELKAGEAVTIWVSGCDVWRDTSTELVWFSQTSWGTGEQLLVCLYSNTGEVEVRQGLQFVTSQNTYQETDPSLTNQDSAKRHIILDEVDLEGKYVRLCNMSNKDQPLKDWELYIHVNNRKPILFKFPNFFKLTSGKTVTIWASGCGVNDNPSTDLVWRNQNPWGTGEQLLVSIYSSNGELEASRMLKPEKSQGQISHQTSQDSDKGRFTLDEVDPEGKFVCLCNASNEDQELQGWELHIRVNNRKPIMRTFNYGDVLKAGMTFKVNMKKSWSDGDQLLIFLYSITGEEMAMKKVGF